MHALYSFFFKNNTGGQTIAKNTVWLFIGEVGGRLARFILIVFAARLLGTGGWGSFAYALSFASIFTFFSDWGFNILATKFLSQIKNKETDSLVATIFYSKLFFSSFVFVATCLLGPRLTSVHDAIPLISIAASIVFFDALRELMLAINRSTQKMEREALIRIGTNILICAIGIALLTINPIVQNLGLAYMAGSALGLCAAFLFIRHIIVRISPFFSWQQLKPIFRMTWPFALLGTITVIIANMDMFFLGIYAPVAKIGIYAAAQRTTQLLRIVPSLFAFALFPQLSQEVLANTDRFRSLLVRSTTFLVLIVLPLVVGGTLTAPALIPFLFGDTYQASAPIFGMLLLSLPFVFTHIIFGNALIAEGKQKALLGADIIGASVGVLLNIALVPTLSIFGTVLALIATHLTITSILWYMLRMHIPFLAVVKKSAKGIFATTIMGLCVFLLQSLLHLFIVSIIVGIVVYIGLLFAQKEVLIHDILAFGKK